MNIRIIAVLFLVATLLIVTACGSESDSPAPAGGTTERPGTTTNAPPNVPADTEAVAYPAPQVEIAEPEQFFKTQNFKDDFLGIEGVIITEYTGSSKELIIPSTIGGKQVVIIGNGSNSIFRDDRVRENVESVVIPYGVVEIRSRAFRDSVFRSIEIPDSVKIIGELNPNLNIGGAFQGNANLENIVLPEGLEIIGDRTFASCVSLTSIEIPDSVTNIGRVAFHNTGITSIVISGGVERIEWATFSFSPLESVIISYGVNYIGTSAFSNVVPPEYSDNETLKEVFIPDSVTIIDNLSFAYCKALTSIEIPDSVTSIGTRAFEGCENLTDITFRGISYSYENIQELYDAINNQ